MHIRGRVVTDRNAMHEKRIRVGRTSDDNYGAIAGITLCVLRLRVDGTGSDISTASKRIRAANSGPLMELSLP